MSRMTACEPILASAVHAHHLSLDDNEDYDDEGSNDNDYDNDSNNDDDDRENGDQQGRKQKQKRKLRRVEVGGRGGSEGRCKAINHVLGPNGLEYGEGGLCCISGGEGVGVDELAQTLLTSHLLSHPTSSATIVDAKGTFDVARLYRLLVSRLQNDSSSQDDRSGKAGEILDRVKIMRVFDFDGMVEGVCEMKEGLERKMRRKQEKEEEEEAKRLRRAREAEDRHREEEQARVQVEEAARVKSTIADSQDDEDEMLDDIAPAAASVFSASDSAHVSAVVAPNNDGIAEGQQDSKEGEAAAAADEVEENDEENEEDEYNMLVIDSLNPLLTPIIRDNYVHGQALLTSFLRSLAHTARQHNVAVLLLNSTVSYKDDQDAPSAFAGVAERPGLGKGLGYMVDVGLMVHRMPRSSQSQRRGGRKWEEVSVVEVLQDRDGDRVGRIGLFCVDDEGFVKDAF